MSTITGKTNLVGLLGQPVSHSLSPVMHNAAYEKMGLDWCYLAISCEKNKVEQIAKALRHMNCKGLNITIPHKQEALKSCKRLTATANSIQAVNTLIPGENNQWIGANTDVEGFLKPLQAQNLKNKQVVVIGCGGSARAVVFALNRLRLKQITIIGRNEERLNNFIKDMTHLSKNNNTIVQGICSETLDLASYIEEANLIINTTPVGMNTKNISEKNIPLGNKIWQSLSSQTILYDLIYTPRPTNWLKIGKEKNCLTLDGLDMLVEQGALSIKLWSGFDTIPTESMKSTAKKHLMLYS